MKYIPNTNRIGIEYHELVPEFISASNYDQMKYRKRLQVTGRGGNGNGVLIDFDSLPEKLQRDIEAKHGDLFEYMAMLPIKNMVSMDMKAREFFSKHIKAGGGYLPVEYQQQYSRAADWLNMILFVTEDKKALKEHLKIDEISEFWKRVIALHQKDRPVNPKLPVTIDNLRKLVKEYKDNGYAVLISKKFGNQNTRKVSGDIERLIMSLYCMPDKPYFQEVARRYWKFMDSKLKVVDLESGEVFNPQDFYIKAPSGSPQGGKVPYMVSAATVRHYMNMPRNRQVVDKYRLSKLEYATTHIPHMLRMGPQYAFSGITMDDTSSPFKMHDNTRPSCYKIFDMKSGAQIGFAIQRKSRPDVALIRQALMDMFQNIIANKWKMPAEIEVENALTSTMTGNLERKGKSGERDRQMNGVVMDVLTAGAVFQMVTFCAAQNPQEKSAEGFINQIKYGFQKHREGFQHRIFARKEANRANKDGVSHNTTFSFEEIEAMEREDMEMWNNSEHPDHPGMTRWEVCDQMQNPALNEPHLPTIMQYIGYPTETSVRRMRVMVMGNLYRLPAVSAIEELDTKRVMAYWIPSREMDIPVVYLYQGNEFICTAMKEGRFQRAKVEQTHTDMAILGDQRRYKTQVLEQVESRTVPSVGLIASSPAFSLGEGPKKAVTVEDDEQEELGKYADLVLPPVEQEEAGVYMPIFNGSGKHSAIKDI